METPPKFSVKRYCVIAHRVRAAASFLRRFNDMKVPEPIAVESSNRDGEGIEWVVVRHVAFSDTSSSFSIGNARQLRLFEVEVRSILEDQRPQCVHVLYFDVAVHKVETYEAVFPPILAHFSWIRRIRKFRGISFLV